MHRIVFVITSLDTGGAQMMLLKLMGRIDRSRFEPVVVSLVDGMALLPRFRELEVPVVNLRMKKSFPDPRSIFHLKGVIERHRADLVQTWMYHADLIGGLAARWAGVPVLWNIRHSRLEARASSRSTVLIAKICARLSSVIPRRIVCCAEEAIRVHAELGYDRSRMMLIPNGFDLSRFKPDAAARESVRRELQVPENALLVGLFGRFHPQKDHRGFIEAAAAAVSRLQKECFFVLCGDGITWDNPDLSALIGAKDMSRSFRLLGRREDMPRMNSALDVACSSSACGEAFSNTIGEAMSCAIACAVTDVGDSAAIVGTTGKVVPPCNPGALADVLVELLSLSEEERREIGARARARVMEQFSLDRIVDLYEGLYQETLLPARTPMEVCE